jgi:hypothetical protein
MRHRPRGHDYLRRIYHRHGGQWQWRLDTRWTLSYKPR